MFRRRLTIALAVLAAAAVLEGLAALWALNVADRHIQRGRIASDIQLGFVELSAGKQRLRTWVSQRQLDAGADPAQREHLQSEMKQTVTRLQALARRAAQLDRRAETTDEHRLRQEALQVLAVALEDLERAVDGARPLQPGTDAKAAWMALSELYDNSQGRDLRSLLAESIAREAAAVQRERAAADSTLLAMRTLWLAATVALALAALLLAAYFTRALRRPLDRLSKGAQALQRGELSHRIVADGADEFAGVARSVNAMAAELAQHRDREARARQRLEEQVSARTAELQGALHSLHEVDARRRRLFADISHELRTPTTAIQGEAEVALRGRDKPAEDYKAALQRIVETARQLGLVIDDLLTMARSDIDILALDRRRLDLTMPFDEALAQACALAGEHGITVEPRPPAEPLPLLGDAQRLRQLMALLLDNAIRYSLPGGRVQFSARRSVEDGYCEIVVADEGIGIAPADLPRVFERNFRAEAARRHRADGTGLGLAIGAALARAHGGAIALDSTPGRGTTVTLRLPLLTGDLLTAVA
jgi:two-component system OmpR family sensor kinase